MGDHCLAGIRDADCSWPPAPGSNSLGTIVQHLHGNMFSRWTEFLTSDGEKPWRNRDGEFHNDVRLAHEVRRLWDAGWTVVEATLAGLQERISPGR